MSKMILPGRPPEMSEPELESAPPQHSPFTRRLLRTVVVVLIAVGLAVIVVLAVRVLLLVFAGALVAVLLRVPTRELNRWTGLPIPLCLGFTSAVIVGLVTAVVSIAAPDLINRGQALADQLIATANDLLIRFVPEAASADGPDAPTGDLLALLPDPMGLLGGATAVATGTIGALVDFAIILFIGIYFAASPQVYLRGFVRLFGRHRRARIRRVMLEIAITLRFWLLGQSVAMLFVGIVTTIGLTILNVPMAGLLGLVAGLMTFVPYVGPILSAIPVLLVAYSVSTDMALYTFLFYVCVQSFEGYVLTPNVQARAVYLPAGLTIVVQVLLGTLLGGLGLALATPLAAASLVAINRFYVEDVLGDYASVPFARSAEDDEDSTA